MLIKQEKELRKRSWDTSFSQTPIHFLCFPLTFAIFLLCRPTGVISHIDPKVIFALYWHPVEIQEHIKQ